MSAPQSALMGLNNCVYEAAKLAGKAGVPDLASRLREMARETDDLVDGIPAPVVMFRSVRTGGAV